MPSLDRIRTLAAAAAGSVAATLAVVPAQAAPAVTPMAMLQLAIEKGAGLEQLEKLMALQERWEANEARKAFVAAKAAFKQEPLRITKNKTVSFGRGGGGTRVADRKANCRHGRRACDLFRRYAFRTRGAAQVGRARRPAARHGVGRGTRDSAFATGGTERG